MGLGNIISRIRSQLRDFEYLNATAEQAIFSLTMLVLQLVIAISNESNFFINFTQQFILLNFLITIVNAAYLEPFFINPRIASLNFIRSFILTVLISTLTLAIYFTYTYDVGIFYLIFPVGYAVTVIMRRILIFYKQLHFLLIGGVFSLFSVLFAYIFLTLGNDFFVNNQNSTNVLLLCFVPLIFYLQKGTNIFKQHINSIRNLQAVDLQGKFRFYNVLSWIIDFLPSNFYLFLPGAEAIADQQKIIRLAQLLTNPLGQVNGVVSSIYFARNARSLRDQVKESFTEISSKLFYLNGIVVCLLILLSIFGLVFNRLNINDFVLYILPILLLPLAGQTVGLNRSFFRLQKLSQLLCIIGVMIISTIIICILLVPILLDIKYAAWIILSYFVAYAISLNFTRIFLPNAEDFE